MSNSTAITVQESTGEVPVSRVIRDVITESTSNDPVVWVDEVVAQVTDFEAALRELVRARISSEASKLRTRGGIEKSVTRGPFRSAKVQGIREEFWPQFLRQRIVGVDGYVRLADATVDDLVAAADRNEVQAAALLSNANRLRVLADEMRAQGVERLGELRPMSAEEIAA